MNTILLILQEILGEYSISGDEYIFNCVFCKHHKRKLSVNITKQLWKCWTCGEKGHLIVLFKRLNLSSQKMREARAILAEEGVAHRYHEPSPTTTEILRLPDEFKPLWKPTNSYEYKNAVSYLKRRGITGYDIIRYGMGYCESGEYKNRIVVPSYDEEGNLNYFVARNYYGDGGMKYKNPPTSKNVVVFEDQVNWQLPVVLCEGVFDAIMIRRNAIPMLGKYLPKLLELRLIEHEVKQVYILLDDDARTDALKLEQKLIGMGIETRQVFIFGGDAADLGFNKTWSYIDKAKSTSFKDFIKNRLQTA